MAHRVPRGDRDRALESLLGRSRKHGDSDVLKAALRKGAGLQDVLMLQLLQNLQEGGDKGELEGAAGGGVDGSKVGSMARAFAAGRRAKDQVFSNPIGLIEEYKQKQSLELKMSEGGEWTWDLPAKGLVRFGKMRGLRRVWAALSQICHVLDRPGGRIIALAMTIQLLKALRQVAIDKGGWRTAWRFINLPDPYTPAVFGGTERELEIISAEVRAEDDLKARLRKGGGDSDSSGTDDDPQGAGDNLAPGADGKAGGEKKKKKKKKKGD